MSQYAMSHDNLPDYTTLEILLQHLRSDQSAAYLHGHLCGYLCADKPERAKQYLESLNQKDEQQDSTTKAALKELMDISTQQINTSSFNFHLLLPDDEDDLPLRVQSLSDWCFGFQQALLNCGIEPDSLAEQETRDVLIHIEQFSEIDHKELSSGEEDEKAYTELLEYLRMAVLMLHTDLNNTAARENDETLH